MELIADVLVMSKPFLPFIAMLFFSSLVLWFGHWSLIGRHTALGGEKLFPRQLVMLALTFTCIILCILVMPISDGARNQLIGLLGILLSGVIAFSSTTIMSNLMAGLMLRMTKPFRLGDFVRIGDYFGRVSDRGLFNTEIQTETREIITLPNSFCISHPVSTVLSSGTIVSVSLSLGYDLDHKHIEKTLLEAAQKSGLTDPFVHIMSLGDFSVTYRISGLLEEAKRLISAKSTLYAHVLDELHGKGIEIVSPNFMNQRQMPADTTVIPTVPAFRVPDLDKTLAEDIVFDLAEKAETLAEKKKYLYARIEQLSLEIKEEADKDQKKSKQILIERMQSLIKLLEVESNKKAE